MFLTYLRFEWKLLLQSRKNSLLGVAVIIFFPLYYLHYSQLDIEDMQFLKNEEAGHIQTIFNAFPEELRETTEGEKIYNNLTQQSSLINMQRFYLWKKEDDAKYIEDGLLLNELRLELHDLGNKGIHPNYIVPKEEIYKETARLQYYREHKLSLQPDPFVASNYLPVAIDQVSGLLFCLFVLLMGSSMMLHDQQKKTVMSGFPISFMQKMHGKVLIHFIQIMFFIIAGVFVGGAFVALKAGWGNFNSPVLIYEGGQFITVSVSRYFLDMLIAFALITLLLLYATAFLNNMTKNLYATVLTLLGIIVLPDLMATAGITADFLQPIKFIDIGSVLSGEAAMKFGNDKMDFKHTFAWLLILNVIVVFLLYGWNKWKHVRKLKSSLNSI
ncbi:hypothetical protein [Sporosarcina sp. USHLN248]|uniref:hypothetical protein n=1 Tax=Sporosarcina sp. USHLN248 TaxID=3081300 RepID=UPI00301954E3